MAQKVLESGLFIVIVGWLAKKNDNEFTKKLKRLKVKTVIFYDASPPKLPTKTGLVLSTKYVDHTLFDSVKRQGKHAYSKVLEISQILTILESCIDLLFQSPCNHGVSDVTKVEATEPPVLALLADTLTDKVLDYVTKPRSSEMDNMELFAKAFLEALANSEVPGYVTSFHLGQIRQKHCPTISTRKLEKDHWIVGEKLTGGERISRYKPGSKMLEAGTQEALVPDTPAGRMIFLIGQKGTLEGQFAELESRLNEVKEKLAMIKEAEAFLAKFK